MKLHFKTITLLFLATLFTACNNNDTCISGEGTINTTNITVDEFDKIDISISSNVTISQGESQEVKITGHSNIISELKTSVTNNQLSIDLENGCYRDYKLDINITIPILEEISANGSSDIIINNFENQNALEIFIGGSGNITLNEFEGITNLELNISGSGWFEGNNDISTLNNSNINIAGSGSYYGYKINSNNITTSVSGSGKARVSAIDNLDATISGSGKIYYIGNPVITESITGSGKLINSN